MSVWPWIHWLHLVAAAIWLGGMITLGAMVLVLRREGVDRRALQAAARAFGTLSWSAMGLAVLTGIAQVDHLQVSWGYSRLQQKLAIVGLTVVVALVHTRTAKKLEGRARAAVEGTLLILSLLVFAAAIRL